MSEMVAEPSIEADPEVQRLRSKFAHLASARDTTSLGVDETTLAEAARLNDENLALALAGKKFFLIRSIHFILFVSRSPRVNKSDLRSSADSGSSTSGSVRNKQLVKVMSESTLCSHVSLRFLIFRRPHRPPAVCPQCRGQKTVNHDYNHRILTARRPCPPLSRRRRCSLHGQHLESLLPSMQRDCETCRGEGVLELDATGRVVTQPEPQAVNPAAAAHIFAPGQAALRRRVVLKSQIAKLEAQKVRCLGTSDSNSESERLIEDLLFQRHRDW